MHYVLLHCPTGHLSAAACGIAAGLLSPESSPSLAQLRRFFAAVMVKRRYGQVNLVAALSDSAAEAGTALLSLGRGTAGPVVDTALAQLPRIMGGAITIQAGSTIRPKRTRSGLGALPTPAQTRCRPSLYLLLMIARMATTLRISSLADLSGALAVQSCYREIAARALLLPCCCAGGHRPSSTAKRQTTEQGRVVYHCFGAAHSSVTAAALHTGMLPSQGPVSSRDITMIPAFDSRAGPDIGRAVYYGEDQMGYAVFVIGFDGARGILTRAYLDLLDMVQDRPVVVLADTLNAVSVLVRLGGYLSRRLRLVTLGRPLAALGIARSISQLRDVVEHSRQSVGNQPLETACRARSGRA